MINNLSRGPGALAALVVLAGAACEPKPRHPGALQGVVELDERVLGFEMGGRVASIAVRRGDTVQRGALIAALDDTLERTTLEARRAEAEAARATAALVRAGARPEEVRSVAAQLRAARASEALVEQNLARDRALYERGALAVAAVDDLESRHRAATAERQVVEQRLRGLANGSRRQEIERAEAEAATSAKAVELEGERVERHKLWAADPATVLDVHVEPSEVVSAGAPVVTLGDPKHPFVDVFVPEGDLEGVRVGALAEVGVDSTRDRFAGRVESVAHKTGFTPRYLFSDRERANLVVRVRVRVDDPVERLHAGVPAFVVIDRRPVSEHALPDGQGP